MIDLKSTPFLRILCPYVTGIVCVLQGFSIPYRHLIFILAFLLCIASFLVQYFSKKAPVTRQWFFLINVNILLFLLAFETSYVYDARHDPAHYSHYNDPGEQSFVCTVSDMPVSTAKSLKLQVELNGIEQGGRWHYTRGRIVVYIGQPANKAISTGDRLYIQARLSVPAAPQNPGEFDYKTFLERKNIFHTAYVSPEHVMITGRGKGSSFIETAGISMKEYVVRTLRDAGLSQEAFSICTALLVGYDDEISGDVMQSFSHSGTLHVLSVSGMHTGILYIVLIFMFDLFDKHQRYKKTRCLLVIVALLFFVAITGFSPSVLRAALMLVLVLMGKAFKRSGNSYNTLLFSAFLLLLYNPFLLCDVGFQLSYLAVFGIMYLYPLLSRRWPVENRILKFLWDLSMMSIAATMFTLPVTLYYFHQFPLWFIVSNLVIIPLSIVLMGAAFLLLLCHKMLWLKQCLVFLMNSTTGGMMQMARLTDHPSYGFIDYISFGVADVWFSTALILLVLWFVSTKSYKALMCSLACLLLWLSVSIVTTYRQTGETEVMVFSIRHKSASLLRKGNLVYLQADSLSEGEFNRAVKPYLLAYSGLRTVHDHSDVWHVGGKAVLQVDRAYGQLQDVYGYLIVSNNTDIDLEPLKQIKPLVIADCSNSYTFVKKLKKHCAELGIPFYSVKENGALRISF